MQLHIALLCAFVLVMGTGAARAQSSQHGDKKPANQFRSHQMHQPQPTDEKAPGLSQERLDEIRQLYEQAKKEQAAKIQPEKSPQ